MDASFRICLIVEDKYGRPFFFELVERLKRESILPTHVIAPKRAIRRLPGKCNPEVSKMIIAALKVSTPPFDRVVVIVDAEGGPMNEARVRIKQHVPRDCRRETRIVVLKYCVEEWVCVGLGIPLGDNPIKSLKNWLRKTGGAKADYYKGSLPEFVPKMDINRLKAYPSFADFLRALIP